MSWEHILSRISRNNINTSLKIDRQKNQMVCWIEKVDTIQLSDRSKDRYLVECYIPAKQREGYTIDSWIDRKIDTWIDRKQTVGYIQKDRKMDRQVKRQTDSKIDS